MNHGFQIVGSLFVFIAEPAAAPQLSQGTFENARPLRITRLLGVRDALKSKRRLPSARQKRRVAAITSVEPMTQTWTGPVREALRASGCKKRAPLVSQAAECIQREHKSHRVKTGTCGHNELFMMQLPHEISEAQHARIQDALPCSGTTVSLTNLELLNTAALCAGARVQMARLPKQFGSWYTIYTRRNRWSKRALDRIFERQQLDRILSIRVELSALNLTSVKVRPDAAVR